MPNLAYDSDQNTTARFRYFVEDNKAVAQKRNKFNKTLLLRLPQGALELPDRHILGTVQATSTLLCRVRPTDVPTALPDSVSQHFDSSERRWRRGRAVPTLTDYDKRTAPRKVSVIRTFRDYCSSNLPTV